MIVITSVQSLSPLLRPLLALKDNWDGEGAPAPSAAALSNASAFLESAAAHGYAPYDVDGDVMGGVALWFCGPKGAEPEVSERWCWIACGNQGHISIASDRRDGHPVMTLAARSADAGPMAEFLR